MAERLESYLVSSLRASCLVLVNRLVRARIFGHGAYQNQTSKQNEYPTQDARMMVYSNGPALTDENESALTQISEETLQYWSTLQKRMPARSHPGVSKPKHKKTDSVPLHDLLRG